MNHEFAQIIGGARWLMEAKAFRAMVRRAETASADAIQAAVKAYADRPPSLDMMGDVAIIHMCGPITYKPSWFSMFFGSATIENMQAQFRMALRDESVKTIVFRCDSPGGTVDFCPEFADEIYAARGQKQIVASADTMICSAALWLAAQTDAIYVSSSSCVGSIGVFMEHCSLAKMMEMAGIKVTLVSYGEHKTDGNEYEDLTPEVHAELQAMVDDVGAEFDAAMARGRGVTRKVVADSFGQGKLFRGKKIITAGLADKMGTFAQVMGKLTKGRSMAVVSVPIVVGAGEGQPLVDGGFIVPGVGHFSTPEQAIMAAKKAEDKAEKVEPENGECPDGYEMGEDGMCHLMREEDAKPSAQVMADPRNPGMTRCTFCGEDADDCGGYCYGARAARNGPDDPKSRASVDAQQAEAQVAADNDTLAITLALSE